MNVTKECKNIYLGNTTIKKVFAGSDLVWQKEIKVNLGYLGEKERIYNIEVKDGSLWYIKTDSQNKTTTIYQYKMNDIQNIFKKNTFSYSYRNPAEDFFIGTTNDDIFCVTETRFSYDSYGNIMTKISSDSGAHMRYTNNRDNYQDGIDRYYKEERKQKNPTGIFVSSSGNGYIANEISSELYYLPSTPYNLPDYYDGINFVAFNFNPPKYIIYLSNGRDTGFIEVDSSSSGIRIKQYNAYRNVLSSDGALGGMYYIDSKNMIVLLYRYGLIHWISPSNLKSAARSEKISGLGGDSFELVEYDPLTEQFCIVTDTYSRYNMEKPFYIYDKNLNKKSVIKTGDDVRNIQAVKFKDGKVYIIYYTNDRQAFLKIFNI